MKLLTALTIICIMSITGCNPKKDQSAQAETPDETPSAVSPPRSTGEIERLNEKLNEVLAEDARIEIIAEGFKWAEGPVWVPEHNMLLFSDPPANVIYKWSREEGLSLYLEPSGYTGPPIQNKEPGSNGLTLDSLGRLVMCQHGNRQIARMDAPMDNPQAQFVTLADQFENKKLNSPNDLVFNSRGDLYFTDPPYGLPSQSDEDPAKELDFQGVFRLSADGDLALVADKMSRPNGLALSPDEKTLYVGNSDPSNPIWMAFELGDDGLPVSERVFFDASELAKTRRGLPDGLKVDAQGNIFATGPGGVLILSPEGEHLGTIKTGVATANCAFNEDKSVLYITADQYVMQVALGEGR